MSTELPQLIEAMRRTLREAVAPEVASDHARGQLAAIDDILGKLAGMTVWSPQAEQEQAQALRTGIERFRAHVAGAGPAPELPPPAADDGVAGLPAAESEIRALVDWLDRARDSLAPAGFAELDAILRQALREQLLVQRKRIPLTDFGAMTAAATEP
ncbi:hypothetical protein PE066_05810 [Ramlibacter tataouinensis]|uniref:hypothetical protein n=1 Tax=Ramlibacter tataouinensis TaxID=94132 RepID=UPI0022F383B5|nr:hypothetical protein [Ramlibacter tataouinensis]WBY03051.1 hypothetical protein PE066_05810 [Ramlibacter tataouinensis]